MDVFLSSWGLFHLYDIFQANDIKSIDDLSDLLNECNSSDFNKLVPNILNRLKLRRHFNEYNNIRNKTVDFDSSSSFSIENNDINNSILVDLINLPTKPENGIVIEEISDNCQSVNNSLVKNKEILPYEPPIKKTKPNIKTVEFNLKEILSKTAFGNSLILINEHGGTITS